MIKYLILGGVLTLLIAVPVAHAQTPTTPVSTATIGTAVNPFDLVSLAYQGFLMGEGIPKFNLLVFEARSGRITAEDLVKAAIATRRLPPDALSNRRYLADVDRQLKSLYSSNSN